MNKRIKNYITFSLAALLTTLSACHKGDESYYERKEVYKVTFEAIGGQDVMPVGGYYGPNGTDYKSENGNEAVDFVSDEYYSLIRQAGVNIILSPCDYYDINPKSVIKGLELCEKYDMGYFVMDGYIRNLLEQNPTDLQAKFNARVANYSGYKSYIGQTIIDEPRTYQFEMVGRGFSAVDGYQDSEIYAYCNLLPEYNNQRIDYTGTAEVVSYEQYLDQYIATVKPKFISFDHYCFTEENTPVDNIYFDNLSLIRQKAEENKVPFWTFIQCGGQWSENGWIARPDPIFPNENEFLWNVNTCLAYGAKGMEYFPLCQPPWFSDSEQGANYELNGLIGAQGNLNRWYYYAKKANEQIQAIDGVLMNSYNYGVLATGDATKAIVGSELIKDSFRQLKSVNGNAVAGCFDYNGKTALYVVNYSRTSKQQIELRFNGKVGMEITQRATVSHYTGKTLGLSLEAGEGALVVIE